MYFLYLWEVLKRAFTATPRMTDGLQILAASAIPALSDFLGVNFPDDTGTHVLAYIGMAALAFFAIRLFWAPYSIWKEQSGQIGELKLELSKPERLVIKRLAKHRAKARSKLVKSVISMALKSHIKQGDYRQSEIQKEVFKAVSYSHLSGFGDKMREILIQYSDICIRNEGYNVSNLNPAYSVVDAEEAILAFLNGEITIEAAGSQLQLGIVPETQQ